MKQFLIIFFLWFIFEPNNVMAQSYCLTPPSSTNMSFNGIVSNSSNFTNTGPLILRVYFHVVNDGFNQTEVEQAFDIINQDYNPHNIYFEWDCYIDYITANPNANSTIFSVNNHQDGIDIYLYSGPIPGGRANGVGNSSEYYVSGNFTRAPFDVLALSHVVSHEMGHVLFLWHTHHQVEPGGCEEYVNGSNSDVCGDLVPDTPSDPYIEFNVDANCNWLGSGTDSNGDSYNPDTKNIMSYTTPSCMEYISNDQGKRARNSINSLQYLVDCKVISAPREFFINTTISNHQEFQNDLIIHENVTLTITGSISMLENKKIIIEENAKLIVNGGVISNWCGTTWKGIKVVGGNPDFDVKFTNATIENTSEAAVSMFPPLPWPEQTQHGNGILHADNTIFNNVRRLAEFIAYQPSQNTSHIKNCIQNGGKWGVTNWNCHQILIQDSEFNGIQKDCVGTADGSFDLIHNKFHGKENDVTLNNTGGGIGSYIQNNDFYGLYKNIISNNSFIEVNTIIENDFWAGYDDSVFHDPQNIELNGLNENEITANNFRGKKGVYLWSVGTLNNLVMGNTFEGNSYGIDSHNENEGLYFLQNCFHTSGADISIVGDGIPAKVGFVQGNSQSPAKNCFTHAGYPTNNTATIVGNPEPFYYMEPGTQFFISCKDAVNSPPNVIRYYLGGTEKKGGCDHVISLPPREIDAATQQILDGDYDTARNLLQGVATDEAKLLVFSTYLRENNFSDARITLSQFTGSDESIQDLIGIQNLNILRLESGFNYEPTEQELTDLMVIAQKPHQYSGMARAVYYAFTGDQIPTDVSDVNLNPTYRKSSKDVVSNTEPIVFPNPATDQITVNGNGIIENVSIIDHLGRIIKDSKYSNENIEIDTQSLENGIYYLDILQDGSHFFKRIVINK